MVLIGNEWTVQIFFVQDRGLSGHQDSNRTNNEAEILSKRISLCHGRLAQTSNPIWKQIITNRNYSSTLPTGLCLGSG